MTRVELVTPSLPRKCSTTELHRLIAEIPACVRILSAVQVNQFERKTGLEPATYSLEGYRSTK
ncbi:MAG: hypothetical protein FD166_974 [Bacteroidetes bacterium]|nr:MAG: hypothetical protein FD166_974 [Bacteroidota bacterium]